MTVFACKLNQRIHLNNDLTITPVSINKGVIELEIGAYSGDRMLRAGLILQMLEEAWAQESNKTHSTSDISPARSDKTH
ncbi:MAG: hypothetical protein K0U59_09715 [Gammaproteobacteria bacterium]|nr:hypothetical protein [Gammaproteobacteria bacterium]